LEFSLHHHILKSCGAFFFNYHSLELCTQALSTIHWLVLLGIQTFAIYYSFVFQKLKIDRKMDPKVIEQAQQQYRKYVIFMLCHWLGSLHMLFSVLWIFLPSFINCFSIAGFLKLYDTVTG
jgi:hypothetical protein